MKKRSMEEGLVQKWWQLRRWSIGSTALAVVAGVGMLVTVAQYVAGAAVLLGMCGAVLQGGCGIAFLVLLWSSMQAFQRATAQEETP